MVTLTRGGFAVHLGSLAGFTLKALGTCAVEVLAHTVALGLVLTWVRIAWIRKG